MSKRNKKKRTNPTAVQYDSNMMAQLLNETKVKPFIDQMTSKELEFYKQLLVKNGTLARYTIEQQKKQIKAALHESFPSLTKDMN